ncbi:MAG: tRNA dihydrouridine synthase DusB [Candidatus Rokuibacteriota bacterium]
MNPLSSLDLRLAPMAGVTNAPFRLVARECGAGLLTSEEIDARGLLADSAHTRELARYLPEEHPITFQLLGGDAEVLAEAARRLEAVGADGIDLNMGCPVPKIVNKGHGAALMRDPLAAALIFRAIRKAVRVPFTIKTRGGWDDHTLNATEIAQIAESEGVDAITVHPRTRSQQFIGRAPWEIIAAVVDAVGIPVIGNGDVRSLADAQRMVATTSCFGVMIGRGALGAPWIFSSPEMTRRAKAEIVRRHCQLIEAHLPSPVATIQLRKHLAWYTNGLPFAAQARPAIFAAPDAPAAQTLFWQLWEGAS